MNPWKDRLRVGSESDEAKDGSGNRWQTAAARGVRPPSAAAEAAPICPDYPQCPKEERKYLNEVRAMGRSVPLGFKLSNGLKATEFCLQYIMKNHFKRKQSSTVLSET